jgi:hypothetical protein
MPTEEKTREQKLGLLESPETKVIKHGTLLVPRAGGDCG